MGADSAACFVVGLWLAKKRDVVGRTKRLSYQRIGAIRRGLWWSVGGR